MFKVVGTHIEGCDGIAGMERGDYRGLWYWSESAENVSNGKVLVPCTDAGCAARLEIDTTKVPNSQSEL